MKKAYLLLLLAIASFGNKSAAQGCAQPEMRARMIAEHPEILKFEEDYEKQIQQSLKKIDYSKFARKTSGSSSDSFWYEIPVVVHVIHNYSQEYLADNTIFECLKQWNIVYAKQNPDTIDVIQTFKKYIGNAHIRLHLATIDPNGNPTKGITRTRSYLTYFGDEQAKFDDWSPSSYLNLWFINKMGPTHTLAAAYAHLPADAVGLPFYDGVICLYSYINTDNTINHEVGHCLNLLHPWGSTKEPAVACGDDCVVDTPPTQ